MDSVDRRTATPNKSRLARTFAKVLHIRAVKGATPVDGTQSKTPEKVTRDHVSAKFDILNYADEKLKQRLVTQAFLAKLFATISTAKSAYAQMQFAQFPYDVDGIQIADRLVVSQLKHLSKLRQCYVKKHFDEFSPEKTLILAELQELKSLLKTYEIMGKRLDYQLRLKGSEIIFLKEKFEEANDENKVLEKRLNASNLLFIPEKLKLSTLTPNHFVVALRQAIKSTESFVQLLINKMELAEWDLDEAASKIEPDVRYWNMSHKYYAFKSFVCLEMFNNFNFPNFSLETFPEQPERRQLFFDRFRGLRPKKTKEYLIRNPKSTFAKFCYAKYLSLVHPKMESSLLGNLRQRNLVVSGEYSDTTFFATFSEMAKCVWLLHCLAFSYELEASIFQVAKNCRFSEVYMESVNEEAFSLGTDPVVAFTVVPGFKISKTVIQSQELIHVSDTPSTSRTPTATIHMRVGRVTRSTPVLAITTTTPTRVGRVTRLTPMIDIATIPPKPAKKKFLPKPKKTKAPKIDEDDSFDKKLAVDMKDTEKILNEVGLEKFLETITPSHVTRSSLLNRS